MDTRFRVIFLILCLALITACAMPAVPVPSSVPIVMTSTNPPVLTSIPPGTATTAATRSANTTSEKTGAQEKIPNSCSELEALVGTYIGGVATTKSLGSPQHLSCEFANAKASTMAIVNIGAGGTVASFDTLQSTSAKGGRTVTPIKGLGASAFSVSKNGVPAGVSVLTAQGFVYVVESNLSINQDESLIKQLMKLP